VLIDQDGATVKFCYGCMPSFTMCDVLGPVQLSFSRLYSLKVLFSKTDVYVNVRKKFCTEKFMYYFQKGSSISKCVHI
jgi:hypothetical protein